MERHGDFFPDAPESTDELVDQLARRAAAAEQLMRSLSPSQREELAGLMSQALADSGLADQMAALSESLRALRPELAWDRARQTTGSEPLGYGEATGALAELADLDDLVEQLGQEHPGATLDDVDVQAVERHLGRGAADDVRRLRRAGAGAAAAGLGHHRPGRHDAEPEGAAAAGHPPPCATSSPTSRTGGRASTTCAPPARRARRRVPRGPGSSATPSRIDVVRTVQNARAASWFPAR